MITEIISSIGAWVSGFITTIVDAIGSVVPLFYADDSLTFIGVLALMGLGIGLVTLAISFVRGLVQR